MPSHPERFHALLLSAPLSPGRCCFLLFARAAIALHYISLHIFSNCILLCIYNIQPLGRFVALLMTLKATL